MSSNPALKVKHTSVSCHVSLILFPILLVSYIDRYLHLFPFSRKSSRDLQVERKLDLTDTIKDGARLFLIDEGIRRQLLLALTEDSKLHIQEVNNF